MSRYATWTRRQCSQANCAGPTVAIAVAVFIVAAVVYAHRTGFHEVVADAAMAVAALGGLLFVAGVAGWVIAMRRRPSAVVRPAAAVRPSGQEAPVSLRRLSGQPAGQPFILCASGCGRPAETAGLSDGPPGRPLCAACLTDSQPVTPEAEVLAASPDPADPDQRPSTDADPEWAAIVRELSS